MPFAKDIDPEFCNHTDRFISFTSKGCVLWTGRRYKFWIDTSHHIEVPRTLGFYGHQHALNKLYLYTTGNYHLLEDTRNEYMQTLYLKCGNPTCINPEHIAKAEKTRVLWRYLYDHRVVEGFRTKTHSTSYYIINKEFNHAVCYSTKKDVARKLGISDKMVDRYAITKRMVRGRNHIRKVALKLYTEEDEFETCPWWEEE